MHGERVIFRAPTINKPKTSTPHHTPPPVGHTWRAICSPLVRVARVAASLTSSANKTRKCVCQIIRTRCRCPYLINWIQTSAMRATVTSWPSSSSSSPQRLRVVRTARRNVSDANKRALALRLNGNEMNKQHRLRLRTKRKVAHSTRCDPATQPHVRCLFV